MSTVTYPLDLSGTNPANLVTNELHTVSESHYRDVFFIVPNFAPFYIDNFKLRITVGATTRDLIEDVDFEFTIPYVTGTRTTGKAMYGGVSLHNLELNGILSMEYQTIGGDQVADRYHVLTLLADKSYNPRTCIFDILTNVPTAFPPQPHYQDYDSFYGQEEVVQALNEIRDAILQNSSLTREQIEAFLLTINSSVMGSYLRKTGDTMTGKLILAGNPMEELEAASKKYVDENTIDSNELAMYMSNYHTATYTNEELNKKLNIAGDTMTGYLTLHANPVSNLQAVPKQYVDTTKTDLQNQIDSLNTAVGNLGIDRVTKEYVDSQIQTVMGYIATIVAGRG